MPSDQGQASFVASQLEIAQPPKLPLWQRHRVLLLLLAIMSLAAFFRFYGREFDQNTNQHPDERAVLDATLNIRWPASLPSLLDRHTSPLNLRRDQIGGCNDPSGCTYPYGALPIYLDRLTGWALDTVLPPSDTQPDGYWVNDYTAAQNIGRSWSSIFDLLTVLLVFLIARRLYSSATGLIAAALYSFSATAIQIAHFYVVDSVLVAFMMGALYFSVVLMQRPSWRAAAGAGACIGLAVATKVSVLPFATVVVAAVLLRAAYRKKTRKLGAEFGDPIGLRAATAQERELSFGGHMGRGVGYLALAGVVSVLAFGVAEPYVLWSFDFSALPRGLQAFAESNPWWRRIAQETSVQSGQQDVPYTRQYVGTTPVLYPLQQWIFWGIGVLPGTVTIIGFVAAIWRALRRKPAEILLMSGALPYFSTIAPLLAKWMRYTLPLVPIFCMVGAAFLVRGTMWASGRYHPNPRIRPGAARLVTAKRAIFPILTALSVGSAFLWAVAFMNIYSQPESRVQAATWFYNNVPDGARISKEGWDDDTPLSLPPLNGKPRTPESRGYQLQTFNLYDYLPPDQELEYIKTFLSGVDYIGIASNRLYSSIPRMPWAYPVQSKYYELLYAGKLGFVKVLTTQVSPQLFGFNFNDQSADESFTVYDHPRVDVFKKVSTLTDDQYRILFSTALNRPDMFTAGTKGKVTDDKGLAYSQPVDTLPQLNDYAWNPLAQTDTQWIAVLLWLLAVYVLGFLALPIVFTVCRNLPDRGYALAKLAALLMVSWGAWMVASARLIPFTVWSILLMSALMAGVSALCWRLGAGAGLRDFARTHRGLILTYEAVFLVAFAAVLVLRMLNPDVWHTYQGGEKPMEMAFLNSVLRSPWAPPLDPFFSGGFINYYYYGYFVIGCLIKLIGVYPAIAFNLAVPLFFALTFSIGVSLVYNIIAWSQRRRGSKHIVSRTGFAFGLLAGVLMLVIGNLQGFLQWVMITFPQAGQAMLNVSRNLGLKEQSLNIAYTQFNYWDASRIISGTINEFPYWSFLFADLHPHLIDLPFTLMSAALTLNLVFAGSFRKAADLWVRAGALSGRQALWARVRGALAWLWGPGWRGVLTFGVMSLALGSMAAINSWDFPTYMGITVGGVLLALLLVGRNGETADDVVVGVEKPATTLTRIGGLDRAVLYAASLMSVALLALASLGAYLPFFLNFKALYTSILPLVDGGLLEDGTSVMSRTTLAEFLIVWGLFVFITASYLVYRLWNFPWAAAFNGLSSKLQAPTVRRSESNLPQQAFSRLRPQELTPALAAPPAGALSTPLGAPTLFYRGGVTEDASREEDTGSDTSGRMYAAEAPPSPYVADSDVSYAQNDNAHLTSTTGNWLNTTHTEEGQQASPTARGVEPYMGSSAPRKHQPDSAVRSQAQPRRPATHFAQDEAVLERPGVVPLWVGLVMLGLTAALVVLQLATGQLLLALLVALIGGIAATTLSTSRSASSLFTGLLLVSALIVAMGVELVYLADHLRGGSGYRMNTVFKFYMQVWLLFGAGSAAAIYYILTGLRQSSRRRREVVSSGTVPAAPLATLNGHSSEPPDPQSAETAHEQVQQNGTTSGTGSPALQYESPQTASADLSNWMVWSVEHAEDTQVDGQPFQPISRAALLPAPARATAPTQRRPVQSAKAPRSQVPVQERQARQGVRWTYGRLAWLGALGLFMLASLTFTILGTPDRLAKRFPVTPPIGTLDGMQFMKTAQYTTDGAPFAKPGQDSASVPPLSIDLKYDYAAITWLNKNVKGVQVMAELPLEYYRAYGMRAASGTGLSMVVGGLHQNEQRYPWIVDDRVKDMNDFFTTQDVQLALTLISKYDINYIYLGQLEQAKAGDGIRKFEQLADPKVNVLQKVFEAQGPAGIKGTVIYKVVQQPGREVSTLVGAPVQKSGIPGISITPLPTTIPTPLPTPPVDDPQLKALIAAAQNPANREARQKLIDWYLSNGYPLEAAKELENIVAQDPRNIPSWQQLGDVYQQAGQPDKALKAWESARDIEPNVPAVHNKLGIAYTERKRYDDALNEYKLAVEKDPSFVESYFHMGEVYQIRGDKANAVAAYQSAVDRAKPGDTWAEAARKKLAQLK